MIGVVYCLGDLARDNHDDDLIELHNSLGMLILLLALFRIIWRLVNPKIENESPDIHHLVTFEIVVTIFYVTMLLMPITGYVFLNLEGRELIFFGVPLPNIVSPNPNYQALGHSLHRLLSNALICAFVLHIVGGLYHSLILRKNIFQRILSGRSGK